MEKRCDKMIKKIVIIGLILTCLLLTSTFSVHAADEEKSFTDDPNDVLDIDGENITTKPNIDIVKINYVRENKEVTLTLEVEGDIQNRGDINDTDSENYVSYILSLSTTDHEYSIFYVNTNCELFIDLEAPGSIDFEYSGSTITFVFDFNSSSSETYTGIYIETTDSVSSTEYYTDFFYDIPGELDVEITAPSTGKVGQNIEFSATVSGEDSYEYEWDFDGDLETDSTAESPTHTYNEAGTYEVSLSVIDSDDKQGYASTTITISEDGTSNGGNNNGNNQEDSNSAILLFAAIIAIIVIIGVIIVVLIIRR